jgi:two-component system OmpR family sensor kinase
MKHEVRIKASISIRARLTLWYGGILALLLLLFGGALYGILRGNLLASIDRRLEETARQIQSSVSRRLTLTPSLDWREVVTLPPLDVFAEPGIFVQVRTFPSRAVAATSANLGGQALPDLLPADWEAIFGGQVDLRTVPVGAVSVRLRSEVIPGGGGPAALLQVAASLSPVDEALQSLLRLLLIGGGLGLLLAILGGALLARQALAPVARITETARRIAATEDLGERLPAPRMQDEVGQLTTTLNEMLDRLQRLFQGQQRFIADVSHELRTPLAAIRGNLEVLQRGAQADPAILQESLEDIEREVARLARMVADLLALARADAGMHLESRPVELDRLLLEVYREARHLARGVEVRLGGEDQVQVLGDADRLKQLLLNLVDNALKYTPAGGTVTLSLYREGSWACLAVADSGVGIPPEELPHIFERFYRGKAAGRRGGVGLGLAIARWIAEEHGGQLLVENPAAGGSTFTVQLPLPTDDTQHPF